MESVGEQFILEDILRNPHDPAPYLILGDWLEDHDDPLRAELLRLRCELLRESSFSDRQPLLQQRMIQLLKQGVRPPVPRKTFELGNGVSLPFHFLSPGSFLMGSPDSEIDRGDDEIQHPVLISKGFYLSVYPVTQGQWRTIMGSNPSRFNRKATRPVERVNWYDCQDYCDRLGRLLGRRFRLPTEAEWEYACRGGTTTPFHFGETIGTDEANFDGYYTYAGGRSGIYREKTTPVGSFPCNSWGLYDLHGNVWEWCEDHYHPYPNRENHEPIDPEPRHQCVLRGGSWLNDPRSCRSAYRSKLDPEDWRAVIGFRIVLDP